MIKSWKYEREVMSIFVCQPRPLSQLFACLCWRTQVPLIIQVVISSLLSDVSC